MFESVLRVKYVSFKNCFAYLSPSHKHLNTGICIKVTYGEKEAYFSASIVRNTVDDDSIGISSTYAKLLGINENEFVNVQHIEQLPVVNSITIQPFTKADYEVLEILSQNVQSNLLDQVRVINAGQKLVIWIGNSISVSVIVGNVQPIAPGVLDFLTEVVIKPPDTFGIGKLKGSNNTRESALHNEQFLSFLEKNSSKNGISYKHYDMTSDVEDLCYRLLSLTELPHSRLKKALSLHPFTGFVAQRGPHANTPSEASHFYQVIPSNSPYFQKKLFIRLFFIEDFFDISDPIFSEHSSDNIFLDDSLLSFMQSDFAARVILKKVTVVPLVKEIEIHSRKSYLVNVVEQLKIYLADHCKIPLIWNADFPFEIDKQLYCSLKFLPSSGDYCIIDEEFLRNCSYSVFEEPVRPLESTVKYCEEKNLCMDISTAKDICDSIFSVLFRTNIYQAENIILIGKPGMGKSSILNHIAGTLKTYPFFLNTEVVQCKKIKGKTFDSLQKYFTDIFAKLIFTQPSLLLLDNLQVLCENCEGEETPNSVYFNRVSEMLYALLSIVLKYNSVGIVASTDSVAKLNKHIYRSRGNHLFKNVFTLGDLNKVDRILLLKYFFEQHSVEKCLNYDELSIKTDGFVVQDIEDFYHKAVFEAYKEPRMYEDEPTINQKHCDIALKKSCALSLQNVKFHSAGTKSFDDIGGLHNVKNILIESLLWPVKYSTIFAKAPLRLQSGILLYGPPGTGKTLLAGAAAKQCSLRLISIKGPELLSKYIGASEQAVRDVFEKAQRVKPCILFFDEFDSLAPRRGHDNTGVTDRVVNQFLTQLDGVEALTGVCVLAASSRPDLLDPALLRPGRLDKQLLCPMPNQSERLEILQILSSKLDLSEDVNFNEIASETEGYSGADLQSVLYTAQISSVKDFDNDEEVELSTTKISQSMLLEALSKTRPSLTISERAKYDRIYAKFQGGSVEDFKAGSKVTLA